MPMPILPSSPKVRPCSLSPARSPVATRLVKMPPIDDRFGRSRLTRATLKLVLGTMSLKSAVCMFSRPMLNLPGLARDAAAAQDRDRLAVVADADAAAEEQIDFTGIADAEEAGVLEEERPLLREEQREAIEVDLLIVDLDLREVGVDGRVERQARREAVFQVAAEIEIGLGIDRALAGRERVAERVRRDAEVAQRRRLHAADRSGQRQPIEIELPRNRRPVGALVAAADVALEIDAPRLRGARPDSAACGTESQTPRTSRARRSSRAPSTPRPS